LEKKIYAKKSKHSDVFLIPRSSPDLRYIYYSGHFALENPVELVKNAANRTATGVITKVSITTTIAF
jgi:hypothetical protein